MKKIWSLLKLSIANEMIPAFKKSRYRQVLAGAAFILVASYLNFANAQDSCQKTCVLHSECGIGGLCNNGICQKKSTYCSNEIWSSNSRGESEPCLGYKCDETSGLCLRSAQLPEDCSFGYVMDAFHQCVAQVQCDLTDPNCKDLFTKWQTAREQYEQTMPQPTPEVLSCRSCNIHAECGAKEMCWNRRCSQEGASCHGSSQTGYQSVLVKGQKETVKSCGNFKCSVASGLCYTQCINDNDCALGTHCQQKICK